MDQTINANLNQCIQSTNSIGGNWYYDVCHGTSHWVPWGSLDWLGAITLTLLGVALLLGGLGLIYVMVRG